MPAFRNKRHWAEKPYHPIIDSIYVGDVLEWGNRGKLRTVRHVTRNPETDHVHMVECVKLVYSRYPGPTTLLCRHQLIKNVTGIRAEGIRLDKTALEARLTRCIMTIDEGWQRWHENPRLHEQPPSLHHCITQWETVGILY